MERVCIIGAGSSGIVAAKVLHERNIPFDCFELGSGIGGNWRYENDNGLSAAYRSLHINTSRDKMAYSDFPMPRSYPDFPGHADILAYFENYVDHFDFRHHIHFRTRVDAVERGGDGRFVVRSTDMETGETTAAPYRSVLVANGHHWDANWVEFPGDFAGEIIHSHQYKTPDLLTGKRVLVVGIGNSACDIACEAARHAEATFLSTRRSAHIVPKYMLGQPLDAWATPFTSTMPLWVQRLTFRVLLTLSRGPLAGYGFPEPQHPIFSEHPTISSELLNLVGHGRITMRPNVVRYEGREVVFEDGHRDAIDLIVLATGYQVSFPFLSDALVPVDDNRVSLYHHVIPPDIPGLFFIGLLQPLGAIMPLAEVQSEWVADVIEGKAGLPSPDVMREQIEREAARRQARYLASPRHTLQVDFYPYLRAIKRERRRGRRWTGTPLVAPSSKQEPSPVAP